MMGLFRWISWRTFIAGFIVGYIVAWGMHWATTLYNYRGHPEHQKIPVITLFEKDN